jgi:hypothetical protein
MQHLDKTIATYIWNIWNIWNIHLQHTCIAIATYETHATSRWNIHLKRIKHTELDAMEWWKNLGQHSATNGQPSQEQQTTHADAGPRSSHKLLAPVLLSSVSMVTSTCTSPYALHAPHAERVAVCAPMHCPVPHAFHAERAVARTPMRCPAKRIGACPA